MLVLVRFQLPLLFFFGEYRPLSSEQGKSCVPILVPYIRCSHGTIRVRQPVETWWLLLARREEQRILWRAIRGNPTKVVKQRKCLIASYLIRGLQKSVSRQFTHLLNPWRKHSETETVWFWKPKEVTVGNHLIYAKLLIMLERGINIIGKKPV